MSLVNLQKRLCESRESKRSAEKTDALDPLTKSNRDSPLRTLAQNSRIRKVIFEQVFTTPCESRYNNGELKRVCAHMHTHARTQTGPERFARFARFASPPTGRTTILWLCRCEDCPKWGPNGCSDYIKSVGDIRPDQWHYCAGFSGSGNLEDTWVWRYDNEVQAV